MEKKMDDKEYFAHSAISQSDLKLIKKSFAHFKNKEHREPTASMIFGSALHSFILDGEGSFYSKYVVMPEIDRRTSAGKAAYNDLLTSGKTIISHDDWYEIMQLKSNCLNHPRAKSILSKESITMEGALFGKLEGVDIKGKLDIVSDNWVVDIKTCQDASKEEFTRSISNFGYHLQAAFYIELAKQNGVNPKGFIFICIERKAASHGVAVYELSKKAIDLGYSEIKFLINKYKEYVNNPDKYIGY